MGDDNWSRMEKFISPETIDATCKALQELSLYQERLFSVVLHGGEPLLLGSAKLTYLLSNLRDALPFDYPISLQTNGILISREILDICSRYRISVAVSIDGPRGIHDSVRVNHKGEGTFDEVIAGINLLASHPDTDFLNAGALAVIDPQSNPYEVYSFFKNLPVPSVDFLYKDGNHSRLPSGKSSPSSVEYGKWMSGLLDAYLSDESPMPIRVLDDMLKVLLGGVVSKEGMGLTDFSILIIDTDGTFMKNDTLKSSFNGADKFSLSLNVKKHKLLEFLKSVEFEDYCKMQRPTNQRCLTCPELNICGGGMVLHRWSDNTGFDNPSIYCADQMHLIASMRTALSAFDLAHA